MIRFRAMTAADIDLGMQLKSQAGWNQVPADWHRMLLMQPEGCFVAEWDGVAVGTSAVCVFGSVAWIAMVLVDESVRGRGVGTELMRHALAFADRQGVRSVRLDATPLGQPLYEKLGFAPQYSLTRFAGRLLERHPIEGRQSIIVARPRDERAVLELDRKVTQTVRSKFLLRLLKERPERFSVVLRGDQLSGFITMRPGSRAWQLGPCIADPDVGEALLRDSVCQLGEEAILVDIPEPNTPAMQWAANAGLQSQRRLLRMCRGAMVSDDTSRLWASSGPELG